METLDLDMHIDQLSKNKTIVQNLVANITQEQAGWRPAGRRAETRWTLLEVVNHLLDIEIEDFRYALELILFRHGESWPNFNIEEWRIERKYNDRSLDISIEKLTEERGKSIIWLRDLKNPDLDALHSGKGFKGERLSAGDILIGWVAHDLFHIRQLSLLRWEILKEWSKPYSPEYSGFEA
jgi:hypothetical protein